MRRRTHPAPRHTRASHNGRATRRGLPTRRGLALACVLGGIVLAAVPRPAMAQTMQTDWQAKWANARAYTLAVADAMPDSLYAWRPDYPANGDAAGEPRAARTFGEQLVHLARNVKWLSASKLRDGETPPPPAVDAADKAAVRAYVEQAFDSGAEALAQLTFAELDREVDWFGGTRLTRRRVGLLLFDHVTHHRAQAIVYLRLRGLPAPRYVGW